MERVGSHSTNEAISSLESDEAIHLTPIPLAHWSHEGEAPELVAGYLGRIGRGELLTKEDWSSLARSGPEI